VDFTAVCRIAEGRTVVRVHSSPTREEWRPRYAEDTDVTVFEFSDGNWLLITQEDEWLEARNSLGEATWEPEPMMPPGGCDWCRCLAVWEMMNIGGIADLFSKTAEIVGIERKPLSWWTSGGIS